MREPADVTAEIEEYAGGVPKSQERLRYLAEQYAGWSKLAKERLELCASHVREGRRAEALRLAEEQPRVLELIAALELRRYDDWVDTCRLEGLAEPEELPAQALAAVNEAYAAANQLEPRLRWFHLQSLAGVPLVQRLQTLRSLLKIQPDNAAWREDVQAYERARQEQILQQANVAAQARDVQTLAQLFRELEAGDWLAQPPADLVRQVQTQLHTLEAADARQRLDALWPALDDAYAAMNYDEATDLLREWNDVSERHRIPEAADRAERLAAIRHWLAAEVQTRQRQRQFEQASFELARDVDEQKPLKVLLERYRAAQQFDLALDHELETKYRAEVARQQTRERRRRRTVAAISAVALVGLLVAAIAAVHEAAHRARAQEHSLALAGLMDDEQVAEAQRYFENLANRAPAMAQHPVLQESKRRLDKLALAEAQRREWWQRLVTQAQSILQKPDLAQRAADPARAAESSLGTQLQQADDLLSQASSTAKGAQESSAVQNLRVELQTLRRARQLTIDGVFSQDLNRTLKELRALTPESLRNNPAEFERRLESVSASVAHLGLASQASPALRDDLDPLSPRLDQLRAQLLDHKDWLVEQEDLERLGRAAISADTYLSALQLFVEKYPDSPTTIGLKRVIAQADQWRAVPAWEALWQELGPRRPLAGDPHARVRAIEAYERAYPQHPFGDILKRLREYESQAARAIAADGPWHGELRELLRSDLLTQIDQVVVRTADAERLIYYVPADRELQRSRGQVWFPAIVTRDRTQTRLQSSPEENFVERRPAPQVLVGEQIADKLRDLQPSRWHRVGWDLARLIRDDDNLDPILKALLLEQVFRLTSEHGGPYREEALRILSELQLLEINDLPWMDPAQPGIERARHRIADGLAQIVNEMRLANVDAQVQRQEQSLAQGLTLRFHSMLILLRDEDRQWRTVAPAQASPEGAVVCQLQPAEARKRAQLVQVGEVLDNNIQLDDARLEGATAGMPLFLMEGPLP